MIGGMMGCGKLSRRELTVVAMMATVLLVCGRWGICGAGYRRDNLGRNQV